jgi:hypothetical protein
VIAIAEALRIASGLGAFVAADSCTQPTVHASVTLAPNGLFPPGQATKALAPDPAHAALGTGPGGPSVTIYSCK